MCSTASSFSVAKNRSATIPTKNGDTSAAMAVAPYASPTCGAVKFSVCDRYVPIVTNHAPHTKYCRNIIDHQLRAGRGHGSVLILMLRSASTPLWSPWMAMYPLFDRP